MKKKLAGIWAVGLCLILLLVTVEYFFMEEKHVVQTMATAESTDLIIFSVPSGVYDTDITVTLRPGNNAPLDTQIRYSTDGSEPAASDRIYSEPINFHFEKGKLKLCTVKAVLYHNGQYSKTQEKTYVLTDDIKKTLGDVCLMHISSDQSGLYDYEKGIMVPGITYDENVAAGVKGLVPGNYNQRTDEWIRDAKITMFSPDGERLLEQNIGLAIAGGTSASMGIKSLKLIAGNEYDPAHDKFHLQFYDHDQDQLSLVCDYTRLRLHAGQDYYYGSNLRSAVVSRLANESGFDGCTDTKRCLVFLNGKYYHILDLQQNYSDSFLKKRFSLDGENCIETAKGGEKDVFPAMGVDKLFSADLTVEENRAALEKAVDMDNFLQYYAINVMIQNNDWPQNNFEGWRYIGTPIAENPYSDGRLRFLIFDPDVCYYGPKNSQFFDGCGKTTLSELMNRAHRAFDTVFVNVMKAECYRNHFLTILSDYMSTVFNDDNLLRIVNEEYEKISALSHQYNTEELIAKNDEQYAVMLEEVKKADDKVKEAVAFCFGCRESFRLAVATGEGVQITWNHMNIGENGTYAGTYYTGVPLTLTASSYAGYRFSCWEVNGEQIKEETLTLDGSTAKDGVISVKAVATRVDEDSLFISEICAKSDTDWFRLTNAGETEVDLSQYFVTDDSTVPTKCRLPRIVLKGGESVTINCKNNYYELGDYICNFNLKAGETLSLSSKTGVVDKLIVPQMNEYESYGRLNGSNTFYFFDNQDQKRKSLS